MKGGLHYDNQKLAVSSAVQVKFEGKIVKSICMCTYLARVCEYIWCY